MAFSTIVTGYSTISATISRQPEFGKLLLAVQPFRPLNRSFPTKETWPAVARRKDRCCIYCETLFASSWSYVRRHEDKDEKDDEDNEDAFATDIDLAMQCHRCYTRRVLLKSAPLTKEESRYIDARREFIGQNPRPERCGCCGKLATAVTAFPKAGEVGLWLCNSQKDYFKENGELDLFRKVDPTYTWKTAEMGTHIFRRSKPDDGCCENYGSREKLRWIGKHDTWLCEKDYHRSYGGYALLSKIQRSKLDKYFVQGISIQQLRQ